LALKAWPEQLPGPTISRQLRTCAFPALALAPDHLALRDDLRALAHDHLALVYGPLLLSI